jgi:hypothetical protein
MHGSATEFEHSTYKKESNMSQQTIPPETLTTNSGVPVEDNQNRTTARPLCLPMAGVIRMTDNAHRKEFKRMIKKFSKLTTPVKPFVLRILKTGAARTLLLAIGTFATLLCSGCVNGAGGERANSGASFISRSDQRQDTFGIGGVPQNSAFVDWTKPARSQTGPTYPEYGGIGEP